MSSKCLWVCCCLCFLQSRSVVLDGGHTPGQHAQCLNTPATHIQHLHSFMGHIFWFPKYCYIFHPGDPKPWFHMMHWTVPSSSISSYTLTSLTVPSFLYSSVMCVPWSTLVNYAFQFYPLHCNVLAPGHVIASVSPWNQELLTKLWDVFENYRSS